MSGNAKRGKSTCFCLAETEKTSNNVTPSPTKKKGKKREGVSEELLSGLQKEFLTERSVPLDRVVIVL